MATMRRQDSDHLDRVQWLANRPAVAPSMAEWRRDRVGHAAAIVVLMDRVVEGNADQRMAISKRP